METIKINLKTIILTVALLFLNHAISQEAKVNLNESKLVVFGTSNIHDWHVDAKVMSGKGDFVFENQTLKTIKSLSFSLESESLKSGKSGMDTNTYKALKTGTYKTIDFKIISVTKVTSNTDGSYTVDCQGNLTICGVTKKVNQSLIIKAVGSKVILIGKQKIDMTVYGIEPPKALMGTIKTGKEVTVDFKITFN